MGKKMFVGGLPYEVDEAKLREVFGPYGKVVSAKVIMDRETGRSKGFGFVEMSTDDEAKAATDKLNNSMLGERKIFVNEARPMEPRAPGSFAPRSGPPGGSRPPFGGGPSFGGPPSFGGEPSKADHDRRRNFGPDKKSGGKKSWEKKGEKKGGPPLKGGRKKEDFFNDDDGGW